MFVSIDVSKESCLLEKRNTDMNFMPFRIRFHHNCYTSWSLANSESHLELSLSMIPCINEYERKYVETYYENQLFYFYPLLKGPQRVYQYLTVYSKDERKYCLTVNKQSHDNNIAKIITGLHYYNSSDGDNEYDPNFIVDMKPCDNASYLQQQLFTIELVHSKQSSTSKQHSKTLLQSKSPKNKQVNHIRSQNDLLDHHNYSNSTFLKPVTYFRMFWHSIEPTTKKETKYCVIAFDAAIKSKDLQFQEPKSILDAYTIKLHDNSFSATALIGLKNCTKTSLKHMSKRRPFRDILLLERSTNYGTPYRAGIALKNRQISKS